ncbi:hypothetical protein E4P41_06520 [Geodermatophilus sp. DF01-2]|uniref:hypothetical protein n=1 Tax=Geodermatophilus sp. DF01-2 TaxID=2559610 RepID=UPI001073576A|nr:hypothetical protein [Geodermatophilus sp. DF01_2]TFV62729.1 hypothetical protein E4P41_06520 [Geodermatophilus sp. DF01_2]
MFVGVPVVASTLVADGGTAAPAQRPRLEPLPTLYDQPTRGSLAEDEEWVAGVRKVDWTPDDVAAVPGLFDPPVADRRVAFAGDVPGGRVALVLARLEDGRLVGAWLTGPEGAPSEEMAAVQPFEPARYHPVVLWDAPGSAPGRSLLVAVGHPGDRVEYRAGVEVTAAGESREVWLPLETQEGAGAALVDVPVSWPIGSAVLRYERDGRTRPVGSMQYTPRADAAVQAPVAVADPRGLLDEVDGESLQWLVRSLEFTYGLPADRLDPTLLAGGPVGNGSSSTALVGVTLPSGATAAALAEFWATSDSAAGMTNTVAIGPWPAGTALHDRVVAVPTANSITVSGPAGGVRAEVLLADGTVSAALPLVDGAGTASIVPPAPDSVRVLDAAGEVLAEVPVSEGAG